MESTKWPSSAHEVLVIGATGLTGTIQELLARGDEVTALARNPDALAMKRDHLRVARGEARDAESLERAPAKTRWFPPSAHARSRRTTSKRSSCETSSPRWRRPA